MNSQKLISQVWNNGRLVGVSVWPSGRHPAFIPADEIDQLIEELTAAKNASERPLEKEES